ncbi:MAG TPA: hypothetical protein EYP20_00615, partial [Aigarchaeota archaeon]|nr:hypothetical protein [Aigarchaeota archaeon]
MSLAALILAGLTGLLVAATKYGDPASWFNFGTTVGRIGEKIVGFIVVAGLAGYGFHTLTRKSKLGPAKAALAASLL